MPGVHVLTLACRDRPGITAKVTTYLFSQGGNVIEAQQFNDAEDGDFFMRVAFDLGPADPEAIRAGFAGIAAEYGMRWSLRGRERPRKVMLLVSKFDHCLADLLPGADWRAGDGYCCNRLQSPARHAGSFDGWRHYLPPSASDQGDQGRTGSAQRGRRRAPCVAGEASGDGVFAGRMLACQGWSEPFSDLSRILLPDQPHHPRPHPKDSMTGRREQIDQPDRRIG